MTGPIGRDAPGGAGESSPSDAGPARHDGLPLREGPAWGQGPPWREGPGWDSTQAWRGGPPWAARRAAWRRQRGWGRAGGPWRARRGFGCLFAVVMLVAVSTVIVVGSIPLAAVGLLGGGSSVVQAAALVVLGAAVLALVVVGRTVGRTAATLDGVVAAARRVGEGEYDIRVAAPSSGPRPVRELVEGFNAMAARLEADERQRRTLLADVSHELRTPLSLVQGHVEAILDGVHPADPEHLGAILEETRVLGRLVDDLRTIALAEGGTLSLHREPTDLAILAAEVAAAHRPSAELAGISLAAEVPDDLPLLDVDPVRTREILSNLVANAIRYTPRDGSVRIGATRTSSGSAVRVTVTDTGAGIAPDVLPHVFDRFWKSADSRGSGLGLAIARNLAFAHGGMIEAESTPGRGTTMTVTLPIDASTPRRAPA